MINFVISGLDHVALGFPSVAPRRGRFGPPLSEVQWGLANVVASRIASIRRLTSPVRSGEPLQSLARFGKDFNGLIGGLELIPYSLLRGTTDGDNMALVSNRCTT